MRSEELHQPQNVREEEQVVLVTELLRGQVDASPEKSRYHWQMPAGGKEIRHNLGCGDPAEI